MQSIKIMLASQQIQPKVRGYFQAMLETMQEEKPDLVICAGYTFDTQDELEALKAVTKKHGCVAVVEKSGNLSKLKTKSSLKLKNRLLVVAKGEVIIESRQTIALANQATLGGLCDTLREWQRRHFEVKGHQVLWIMCGELNAFHNPRDGAVRFRGADYGNGKLNDEFTQIIGNARIIVNPTHDRMGRQGHLDKKSKALSGGRSAFRQSSFDGIYVRVSNWNEEEGQTRQPEYLHQIWRRGRIGAFDHQSLAGPLFSFKEFKL